MKSQNLLAILSIFILITGVACQTSKIADAPARLPAQSVIPDRCLGMAFPGVTEHKFKASNSRLEYLFATTYGRCPDLKDNQSIAYSLIESEVISLSKFDLITVCKTQKELPSLEHRQHLVKRQLMIVLNDKFAVEHFKGSTNDFDLNYLVTKSALAFVFEAEHANLNLPVGKCLN